MKPGEPSPEAIAIEKILGLRVARLRGEEARALAVAIVTELLQSRLDQIAERAKAIRDAIPIVESTTRIVTFSPPAARYLRKIAADIVDDC